MHSGPKLFLRRWDNLIALTLLAVVLPAIGMASALTHINRARLVEAFALLTEGRINAQEQFAFGYAWRAFPRPASTQTSNPDYYAETRYGAIDVHFLATSPIGEAILTLRAGATGSGTSATLLWQCGHGEFPKGVRELADSRTKLSPSLLPMNCWKQNVSHERQ